MLAKPQGFPRKLGGCAGLDPRLRSAVSAGVGDGERGLRRGLRAPGVGVRPKWVLEYSPSNKRIRYFVSITYVRTGLWTAHKFCGGGEKNMCKRTHDGASARRAPHVVCFGSTYPVVNGFQIPIYAVVSSWQPVVVEPHADFGSLADSQHTVRILFDRISAHD